MGNNSIAIDTATKLAADKVKGDLKDRIIKETMSNGIRNDAAQAAEDAGLKTFKSAFGVATLFVSFVDTYSKAVKAANLEYVRQKLEVCPHIGGCENLIHAQTMASDTTATVWQAHDGYWYFHPQLNYKVRHPMQIYRTTASGGWRIEKLGNSEWTLQDCLGCVEAHSGN
jgi:hypothetical protein